MDNKKAELFLLKMYPLYLIGKSGHSLLKLCDRISYKVAGVILTENKQNKVNIKMQKKSGFPENHSLIRNKF